MFVEKKAELSQATGEEKKTKNKRNTKQDGDTGAEAKSTDEDSLLKLMSECDFASLSAEKFIERLQNELLALDTVRHYLTVQREIYFSHHLSV